VFVSLDMMLFFAFFEATLIPMYFLINIWGGSNRAYAAIKFFLYTAAGSILMLLAMIMLYVIARDVTGTGTFDIVKIQALVASGQFWTEKWMAIQGIMLGAFLLAFMIKVPMFPFHTWLPDAHVEAPTAGSVILAGVLLKMGTYGIIRFCLPIFPDALPMYVVPISVLAVIGILYGGIVAAVQPDLKKLVAYSSVAHMGFILLGIFSLDHAGLMGGSLQQLNHGVSTGALFLLIGLLYERRHTRMFKDFGGLKAQMPIYATLFLIIMLSSVGLPATNGFVGEFLALMGSFNSGYTGMYGLNIILTSVAATGVIVAAVYLLKMFMQVFYGPNTNPENQRLKDLKPWETVMVGSFVVLVFVGGLLPNVFMKPMEASVQAARLMATKPAGERPAWADESVEVSSKGDIIRTLKTAEVARP
jgi:NADH-quinone oxidoreductase subunit M